VGLEIQVINEFVPDQWEEVKGDDLQGLLLPSGAQVSSRHLQGCGALDEMPALITSAVQGLAAWCAWSVHELPWLVLFGFCKRGWWVRALAAG